MTEKSLLETFANEYRATGRVEDAVKAVATSIKSEFEDEVKKVAAGKADLAAVKTDIEKRIDKVVTHPREVTVRVVHQYPNRVALREDPRVKSVLNAVCGLFGLTRKQLFSRDKSKVYVRPRWVAAALLRRQNMSFPAIGRVLGGQDHSTVMYAVKGAAADPMLQAIVERLHVEVIKTALFSVEAA